MITSSQPATLWRGRTVVLLGICLAAFNLRIAVAAVSPLLETIRIDVPISDTEAGVIGMVPVVAFAVFGSITPPLSRKFGLEPLLIIAMVISGVGIAARSYADTSFEFIVFTLVALSGMGAGNVLLPPLVKRYFPERIGIVTSIYTTIIAVSTALPPLVLVPMADALGWRVSLGQWAAIGLLAAIPWVIVVVTSVQGRVQVRGILKSRKDTTQTPKTRHSRTGGRIWRSPSAWALGIFFGMNSANSYAMFGWLPIILADAGYSEFMASQGLAFYAAWGILTSIFAPMISARMRNPFPLALIFCVLNVAGYIGLILVPSTWTPLWITLCGIGVGTFPMALALVNLRSRTSVGSTQLSGFAQGVGYALAGIGPFGLGVLYDATHAWTIPLIGLIGTMVVLLCAAWFICRPIMIEDQWLRRW